MKQKKVIAACVFVLVSGFGGLAVISQAGITDEDAAESETSYWAESEYADIETPVREEAESADAQLPVQTEAESADAQLPVQTEAEIVDVELPVQTEVKSADIKTPVQEEAESADIETPTPVQAEEESEYADLAIADVTNYVNVRTEPNTDSDIVGKIYDGAVAQILSVTEGEDGDWFQVVSGNAEGYIKAEFFLYGDAAAAVIDDYVTRYATVLADRLNVRSRPDIESSRVGYIDNGERVQILEDLGEWLEVQYTESVTGFVSAEYVTVSEEFVYAKTLEEEAQELAERQALQERQRQSETQAAENTAITITVTPPASYSTNEELRQEIVNYAMQYLGNKYIHGGKTLSGGTDCSGFTSLIYAEFGYSIGRTPESQLTNAGRGIDYSEIQPGDIICYGSSGKCTHVAIYIGDGQIIHSANSRKGVITNQADYDTILGVRNIID